jgi:hypothetical protein
MIKIKLFLYSSVLYAIFGFQLMAQKILPVIVDVDHPKAVIQPTMWGIFFEDINMAADGGIYAELVKNRSFEFFNPRTGWKVKALSNDSSAFVIMNRAGGNVANPRYARIKVTPGMPSYCLSNTGFRGIGIVSGKKYQFTIQASVPDGGTMKMRIELMDSKGTGLGETSLQLQGSEWKNYSATLTAQNTDAHAVLNIWFEDKGLVEITFAGATQADLRYRRDFLTGAVVQRAVQEAATEAWQAEGTGIGRPGSRTFQ